MQPSRQKSVSKIKKKTKKIKLHLYKTEKKKRCSVSICTFHLCVVNKKKKKKTEKKRQQQVWGILVQVQAVKANGGKSGGSGIFRGLEGSSGDPIASHSSGRHLSNKVKCSSRSADRKSASKVKDRRGKCQWKRGDNSGFRGQESLKWPNKLKLRHAKTSTGQVRSPYLYLSSLPINIPSSFWTSTN